jgi:hypothetical protein
MRGLVLRREECSARFAEYRHLAIDVADRKDRRWLCRVVEWCVGYQGASSKRQSAVLSPRGQSMGAFARLAVTLSAALTLAACAAPSSYMGISFAPGQATSGLQDLARRAQAGDKQAQLDLGIAYEEGRGVAVDLKRASALYVQAAATTGGKIYVYQSPTKKGGRGGVVPINLGPEVRGLVAAKGRWAKLKVAKLLETSN